MDILTFFTPSEMAGVNINADVVIVIDVLRGATTISAALKAGAERIIPAADPPQALELATGMGREKVLLAGTVDGHRLDNFDLGNSPSEYSPSSVQRKPIVYCSNNISTALEISSPIGRVLVGCFNNIHSVLASIESSKTLLILCASKLGRFAMEDAVCAGMYIQYILNKIEGQFSLNDASATARHLFYRHHRNILGMLEQSSHGHYLTRLGYHADLEYAAMANVVNIVPELSLDKKNIIPTVSLDYVLQKL